jgi:hypothetical protein
MNTSTISHRRSRRRGRIGRPLALFVTAVAVAAGCGSEQSGIDPDRPSAVEAARGSDRHLELLAREIAEREARVQAAAGSDRHLELLAREIAQARIQAASGSDRHLELLAREIADREARIHAAAGSDRHLELLAADIAERKND